MGTEESIALLNVSGNFIIKYIASLELEIIDAQFLDNN